MHYFLSPRYWITAAGVALVAFVLFSWIPLIGEVTTYLSDPSLPFSDAQPIVLTLLLGSITETLISNPLLIILSIAIGANLTLLVHFMRAYRPGIALRGLPVSVLGMIASIVGIGCAACGAVFITAFSASAMGLLLALPLRGTELAYIGLALLFFSTWHLAKAMENSPPQL